MIKLEPQIIELDDEGTVGYFYSPVQLEEYRMAKFYQEIKFGKESNYSRTATENPFNINSRKDY